MKNRIKIEIINYTYKTNNTTYSNRHSRESVKCITSCTNVPSKYSLFGQVIMIYSS